MNPSVDTSAADTATVDTATVDTATVDTATVDTATVDIASLLTTASTLVRLGPYEITDDPRRIDLGVVHAFLSQESYWRRGISAEEVARSVRMSLPLSAHLASSSPTMVGFVRVVTDTVTHAWIDDLFVLRAHRRRGVAGALVEAALTHPAVAGAGMQLLLTADAHALYERHGFRSFPDPGVLMVRRPGADPRRTG